jgi:hypothetical protein
MALPTRDQVRAEALMRQYQIVSEEIERSKLAGKPGVDIGIPFPEVLDSLTDGGFTVNPLPCGLSWHVSWLGPTASDDEGDDDDGWEAACARCNSSLDSDPAAVDGALPAYMAGMCSSCFTKFYSRARR